MNFEHKTPEQIQAAINEGKEAANREFREIPSLRVFPNTVIDTRTNLMWTWRIDPSGCDPKNNEILAKETRITELKALRTRPSDWPKPLLDAQKELKILRAQYNVCSGMSMAQTQTRPSMRNGPVAIRWNLRTAARPPAGSARRLNRSRHWTAARTAWCPPGSTSAEVFHLGSPVRCGARLAVAAVPRPSISRPFCAGSRRQGKGVHAAPGRSRRLLVLGAVALSAGSNRWAGEVEGSTLIRLAP